MEKKELLKQVKLKEKEKEKEKDDIITLYIDSTKLNIKKISIIGFCCNIVFLLFLFNKFILNPGPHYDYIIVSSGLFGATFNYFAKKAGKTTLVIEKRNVTGGNLYCEKIEGIFVYKYGPHIFHTNNKTIWDFVNSLVEFTPNKLSTSNKSEKYNI